MKIARATTIHYGAKICKVKPLLVGETECVKIGVSDYGMISMVVAMAEHRAQLEPLELTTSRDQSPSRKPSHRRCRTASSPLVSPRAHPPPPPRAAHHAPRTTATAPASATAAITCPPCPSPFIPR